MLLCVNYDVQVLNGRLEFWSVKRLVPRLSLLWLSFRDPNLAGDCRSLCSPNHIPDGLLCGILIVIIFLDRCRNIDI
jgi:hypothetical protein